MVATPSLKYQPALDGLRALCLIAVLLFHSGFGWMSGGFLGVSTFFTLSGYLITSLLLAEREATGTVSFAGFWRRRLRRLMPAALIGISAVVASSPLWLAPAERDRLTGDALAALVYAINWRFVQEDYAYEAIFVAPSPLQHFWSLAIEAQFYLFFPLLVGALVRGGRRRGLAALLGALAAASVALSFWFPLTDEGITRIYYGSDTRFAEILFGALLAVALRGRRSPTPVRAWLAPLGLVGLVSAWVWGTLGDEILYRGGFALYALASVAVVAGAVAPSGLVRTLLSPRWLRWLGRISYGAYVYHWPVFLVLDAAATGLSAGPLLAIRLGVTLCAADLSYRLVERPVRRDARARRAFGWAMVPAIVASAGLALALAPSPVGPSLLRVFGGARVADELAAADLPDSGDAYRIGLFGDSVAFSLRKGIAEWADEEESVAFSADHSRFGCGIVEVGERMSVGGRWRPVHEKCVGQAERWAKRIEEEDLDVAIVLLGTWDVRNWRSGRGQRRRSFGFPEYDRLVGESLKEKLESLLSADVTVVWLTVPHIGRSPNAKGKKGIAAAEAAADPRRAETLNSVVEFVARNYSEVHVADLAGFVASWPGGEFDPELRADGVHFTDSGARAVLKQWLGGEILAALENADPPKRAGGDDALRIALFGDSVGFSLRHGLESWLGERRDLRLVRDQTQFGCGVMKEGKRLARGGKWAPVREACTDGSRRWAEVVSKGRIDVALVATGIWDARAKDFGTPEFERAYAESVRDHMARLVETGTQVVWLTLPRFGVSPKAQKAGRAAAERVADPKRVDRLNEIVRREAEAFPRVHVGDLAGFVATLPEASPLRPDNVHFSKEGSLVIAHGWLGNELLVALGLEPSEPVDP